MKKMAFFLAFALLALVRGATAQTPGTIMVKAGEDPRQVFPKNQKYRYGDFQNGQLIYPKGKRSNILKLNYNMVFGAMQFIDSKGDTLFIAEDSNIFKYIVIEDDLFYHDFLQGYFEIRSRETPVRLLAQSKWKVLRRERVVENGYGNSSSIATTEYSLRRSDINTFIQNENTLYAKDLSFFILGKRERIYKATRSGFIRAFPDHRQNVKSYLNTNTIDFENESALISLLSYCNKLKNL